MKNFNIGDKIFYDSWSGQILKGHVTALGRCGYDIQIALDNRETYWKYTCDVFHSKEELKAARREERDHQALIKTNPYLKDPVQRKKMFEQTVKSSTAIEGVHIKDEELKNG